MEKHSCPDLEKPEKFEKFKKNFSKTLAASLAILNLFSGSFTKAANTSTDDSITTNVGNSKKKDNSTNKKIKDVDSKKKDLLSAKDVKNKELKVNQNKWITKKRVGIGSAILVALFGAYATKGRFWSQSVEKIEPMIGPKIETTNGINEDVSAVNSMNNSAETVDENNRPLSDDPNELEKAAETWLRDCDQNEQSVDYWLKGINIVRKLIEKCRDKENGFQFEIVAENDETDLNGSLKVEERKNNRCIFIYDTQIKTKTDNFTLEEFLGDKLKMFISSRDILEKLEDTFLDCEFGYSEKFLHPFGCLSASIQGVNFEPYWKNFYTINSNGETYVFINMFHILQDADGSYNERLKTLEDNLKKLLPIVV